MPETADPVAALAAKDLPTRAAGARDLAVAGTPAHLDRLLDLALKDPSPGVRLGAAAAAADILSRWRLPPRAADLDDATRTALWMRVRGMDPGVNTGIFQVCAALGVPDAVTRILGGARDPRADVRMGACVGLLRLCASAAVNGDADLEARVVALLDDPRIRVETHAEIARICASVGYASALERIRRLADEGARNVATIAGEAVQRLEWPGGLAGIWADLGLDVGALDTEARPGAIVALTGTDTIVIADEKKVTKEPVRVPPRRLWARRPGATETTAVVQIGRVSYWAAEPDEITTFGDRLLAADAFAHIALVDPLLPPTAATARLRGAARLRSGDASGALEQLLPAIEMKKVPADTWWYLADALHALGRDAEATPHLERFLSKAGKRAPFVGEARRRLGGDA